MNTLVITFLELATIGTFYAAGFHAFRDMRRNAIPLDLPGESLWAIRVTQMAHSIDIAEKNSGRNSGEVLYQIPQGSVLIGNTFDCDIGLSQIPSDNKLRIHVIAEKNELHFSVLDGHVRYHNQEIAFDADTVCCMSDLDSVYIENYRLDFIKKGASV